MSLREQYTDKLEERLSALAIWEPGRSYPLGSVLLKDDDQFTTIGMLTEFTQLAVSSSQSMAGLRLSSAGVKQKIIQSDVEVSALAIDEDKVAKIELEFSKQFDFILRTSDVTRKFIYNLGAVTKKLAKMSKWKQDDYYLVHEVYEVDSFYFAATENQAGNVDFEGNGAAILGFLKAGIRADLTTQTDTEFKIESSQGSTASIAMRLVRVDDDGDLKLYP